MEEVKKRGRKKKETSIAVVPDVVVVSDINDFDRAVDVLLKESYKGPCLDINDLSSKTGVSVSTINNVSKETGIDYVKLSRFKENFAPSLVLNIRNIMKMITDMTSGKEDFNSTTLQKLTSSLNNLTGMLKEIETKKDKDLNPVAVRRIRVSEIIEEFYSQGEKRVN